MIEINQEDHTIDLGDKETHMCVSLYYTWAPDYEQGHQNVNLIDQ